MIDFLLIQAIMYTVHPTFLRLQYIFILDDMHVYHNVHFDVSQTSNNINTIWFLNETNVIKPCIPVPSENEIAAFVCLHGVAWISANALLRRLMICFILQLKTFSKGSLAVKQQSSKKIIALVQSTGMWLWDYKPITEMIDNNQKKTGSAFMFNPFIL